MHKKTSKASSFFESGIALNNKIMKKAFDKKLGNKSRRKPFV